jgi:hypothetical protein
LNTKSTEHFVLKCIGSFFIIVIRQWHQLQPFGKMFNHN